MARSKRVVRDSRQVADGSACAPSVSLVAESSDRSASHCAECPASPGRPFLSESQAAVSPSVWNPAEAIMADLVFIVSRAEPKRYLYLKHQFADESRDSRTRAGIRGREQGCGARPSNGRAAPEPDEAAADRKTPHRPAPARRYEGTPVVGLGPGEAPGDVHERPMTSQSSVSSTSRSL